MELSKFLEQLNRGEVVRGGSPAHLFMHGQSQAALRICAAINGAYHTPGEIRALFSELTGKPVDEGFTLFPPFTADFGKNIHLGKDVFLNSGCRFQDQGGITIGSGALIGHNVVLATLNHGFAPGDRASLYPAPVNIGQNVWLGAGVTVLPGVNIGDNAIVAAGAVVTKDVAPSTLCAGVPARFIKYIEESDKRENRVLTYSI